MSACAVCKHDEQFHRVAATEPGLQGSAMCDQCVAVRKPRGVALHAFMRQEEQR
jgi:hypothetical protein